MDKLRLLRNHLLHAVTALHGAPDRLLTFVEDGSIQFQRGTNYDHRYNYTARIIITEYRGSTDAVMIPLLYWLDTYAPETDPDEAVSMEAEIIDNDTIDLSLSVDLVERVIARTDCDTGRINAHHVTPKFDDDTFCPPETWQLWTWLHPNQDHYHFQGEWPARPPTP